MSTTMTREMITAKQFFIQFRAAMKDWIRVHDRLPATCFVDVRCPCKMNKGHRTETVRVGEYKSNGNGHKKGDPKFGALPNPYLDFINVDSNGEPKPKVHHAIRTHADLRFNYQELVQDAQEREGEERDFKAGAPVWEWRAFRFEDVALPLLWKVWRDPVTKAEIDMPDKDKQVYLYVLPKAYARDDSGAVRFSEPEKPIKLSGNRSWYEEIIGTGINGDRMEIDYSLLAPYMKLPVDLQKEADRQGHGNKWEVVRPLSVKVENVNYIVVAGRRWYMRPRDMGPIYPMAIEDMIVEHEPASAEEILPESELIGYAQRMRNLTR